MIEERDLDKILKNLETRMHANTKRMIRQFSRELSYTDLNGMAIMLGRDLLKEHLNIQAAFFDDCIILAIIEVYKAREEAWALMRDSE